MNFMEIGTIQYCLIRSMLFLYSSLVAAASSSAGTLIPIAATAEAAAELLRNSLLESDIFSPHYFKK